MLFNNMQLMVTMEYVFRCHQSYKQSSQETEVRYDLVNRSCLSFVIGNSLADFDPFSWFVSVFQISMTVTTII